VGNRDARRGCDYPTRRQRRRRAKLSEFKGQEWPPPTEAEHKREREIPKEVIDPSAEARAYYPFRWAEGANTNRHKRARPQAFNMSFLDILSSRGSPKVAGRCYEIPRRTLLRKSHTGEQKEGATGPANRHVVTLIRQPVPT
jgi:hypothetical protein